MTIFFFFWVVWLLTRFEQSNKLVECLLLLLLLLLHLSDVNFVIVFLTVAAVEISVINRNGL